MPLVSVLVNYNNSTHLCIYHAILNVHMLVVPWILMLCKENIQLFSTEKFCIHKNYKYAILLSNRSSCLNMRVALSLCF